MKYLHISDLHLGKRLNEFSLLEDQDFILGKIIDIVDEEKPSAVLISGDVYDKTVPSADAVALFDDFLVRLAQRKIEMFIISGNHDSPERIAFASRIMDASGVHFSPVYDGNLKPIILHDEYGDIAFYMLPFIKPAHVKRYYPDKEIESYTDAIRVALQDFPADRTQRNVLLTHQFVTGAVQSESEDVSVGGSDNVDANVFDAFDYVALGHIHGPQSIDRETLRYCGTPLKYSFSEKDHEKSVTVIEMKEKGDTVVRTVPLKPLHDLREIRGTYNEIMLQSNYIDTDTDDYIRVILTDEEDVPDAVTRIRSVYPNLMRLEYDNTRTRTTAHFDGTEAVDNKTETELFDELYEIQNGAKMSEIQRDYSKELFEKIKEAAL